MKIKNTIDPLEQQVEINRSTECNRGYNSMQVDVSNLPKGVYFAQIILNGNIAINKLFVITK